ncbi:MAG: folate-binding protein YgfZ [Anaerolineae bacterium]|nr:folate-binding protein YgfZ [Anaerolineae bacterium]
MSLLEMHRASGAVLDDAGQVPRHYGALATEYAAAHSGAVLVDRSDEGRIMLADADRLAILHRMSTNAVDGLAPGEGRATVLTSPIGRIIDRVVAHNLDETQTLVHTSAGRGEQIAAYLRRNIFFRDRMQVADRSGELAQVMVYGPQAAAVVAPFVPDAEALALHHIRAAEFEGGPLWVFAADAPGVPGFGIVVPLAGAPALWQALLERDARASGRDVYELLRIESGQPGPEGELTEDIIPLEAALWDEVSFTKGCYTGQEIIARMESRGKLARQLVGVTLSGPVAPGAEWKAEGRVQGRLTSTAEFPDGRWLGLGFVKPGLASEGQILELPDGEARIWLVPGR